MYQWLQDEISEVGTKKYFVVDGPPAEELRAAILAEELGLPTSYKTFLLEFGNAKLYRQRFGYGLGVRGTPVPAQAAAGDELLCIGHFQERQAFFRRSSLDDGAEAPVLESGADGLVEVSSSFASWLAKRASEIRKAMGKRAWARIVAGPPAFSDDENDIVAARQKFSWRWVGLASNGDVRIEVTNDSNRRLPFLSIGVRDKGRTFSGVVWVPTTDLRPTESQVFERECYKKHVPREELELFALPDPEPEDRESYWEFRNVRSSV